VASEVKDGCSLRSGIDGAFLKGAALSLLKAKNLNALPFANVDDPKRFSQAQRTYFHALSSRLIVLAEATCPGGADQIAVTLSLAALRFDIARKEEKETWMMRAHLPDASKAGIKAAVRQALDRRLSDFARAEQNDETLTTALRSWNEGLAKAHSEKKPSKKNRN
jgi:hypothetical protein